MHDQAILFTLVASSLEILRESKRVDILRTVATGGKPTAKSVRTFVSTCVPVNPVALNKYTISVFNKTYMDTVFKIS